MKFYDEDIDRFTKADMCNFIPSLFITLVAKDVFAVEYVGQRIKLSVCGESTALGSVHAAEIVDFANDMGSVS